MTVITSGLPHVVWIHAERSRITLALLLLLTSACATLSPYSEPLRVTLVSVEPYEATLLEQRYRARIRIQNPNDRALEVKGASFQLELNGHEFAHGVAGDPFTVPGFGEQLVEVYIVSTLFTLFTQIRELQEGGREKIDYRISGSLSVVGGVARVPFERSGELDFSGMLPMVPAPGYTL